MILGFKERKRLPRKAKKELSKKIKKEIWCRLIEAEANAIETMVKMIGYIDNNIKVGIRLKMKRGFKEIYNLQKKGLFKNQYRNRIYL